MTVSPVSYDFMEVGGARPTVAAECGADEFRCALFVDADSDCILNRWVCDGEGDCKDDSDELDCGTTAASSTSFTAGVVTSTAAPLCDSDEFTCASGECIEDDWVCDGTVDCVDGSDENSCATVTAQPPSCKLDEFQCGRSHECIKLFRKCDGDRDCLDGSDESDCAPPPVIARCHPDNEIDCGRGVCISARRRCDGGVPDCSSNRDEENCAALISINVSPEVNPVNEGSAATFTCNAVCPPAIACNIQWGYNSLTGALPAGFVISPSGRSISVSYARVEHYGLYYCSVVGYSAPSDTGRLAVNSVRRCPASMYTCGNGRCINRNLLCNGDDDCDDLTDEANCITDTGCEPPEMRCANGRCVQKIWRCDGDDDCKDGTDELRQYCPARPPRSNCGLDQHQCDSGDQCIPRSYWCDKQNDCHDNSDEFGCSAPTVTVPPVPTIRVKVGETIRITCTAIGIPTPLISWRLNWGHIPTGARVTETSINGVGVLIIRDARKTDAGAYTCEAINNQNSIFGNPDAIVTVYMGPIEYTCPASVFNKVAVRRLDCINCFCSGVSRTCESSSLYMMPYLVSEGVTLATERGDEISPSLYAYNRQYRTYTVSSYSLVTPPGNHYWKMPDSLLGKQIHKYGGTLRYNIQYEPLSSALNRADDVIIIGRSLTAYCTASGDFNFGRAERKLELVNSHCVKAAVTSGDIGIPVPMTREEMMEILLDVRFLLIRATYSYSQTRTIISEISIDTADRRANPGQSANLVEVCDCPQEYTGNSCEDCSPGYVRSQATGRHPLGVCVREVTCFCNGHSSQCDELGRCLNCRDNTQGDRCENCRSGYTGDATRGYPDDCVREVTCFCNGHSSQCDQFGRCLNCRDNTQGDRCEYCRAGYTGDATRGYPDDCTAIRRCNPYGTELESNGRCDCKPFTEGTYCDRCKAQTYYLNSDSRGGCVECFCMGVTKSCSSSTQYRHQLESSLDADDWSLATEDGEAVLRNVLSDAGGDIIAELGQLSAGSYYWSLPAEFVGNKLGAYGGKLRFTTKFIATSVDIRNRDPDVIMFGGSGIQLTASFANINLDSREYTAEISMIERYWHRADSTSSTREHFLMALADVQSILIKASFTPTTRQARIGRVTLGVASDRTPQTRASRAYAVEQCVCGDAYQGSSCETCSPGYTRAPGVYLGICTKCNCNGHSDDCDSDRGHCINCAHGTAGRYCERCAQGYERNSNEDSAFDCINPSTLVTIPNPTIRVRIGSRAELVCRPYSNDLPYARIIWSRSDGRPVPRNSNPGQPGRLVIDNVQIAYEGEYVCTITTRGGIVGTGIASLVVVSETCPTGYDNLPDCTDCARGFSKDLFGRCNNQDRPGLIVTTSPAFSLVVTEGEEIRLRCTARSQSVYVVAWSRRGGRLPSSTVRGNGEVYIAQASLSDADTYICTGSNRNQQQSAEVVVTVNRRRGRPQLTVSIDPDKLYVTPGGSGSLQCRVSGDVRSVEWKKSSQDVASKHRITTTSIADDTLTFLNMETSDRGYYYCTAIGTDLVTRVTSEPTLVDFQRNSPDPSEVRSFLTVVQSDVRVRVGADATLECRADSSVVIASVTWTREGRSVNRLTTGNNLRRETSGVFVVRNVVLADAGSYVCSMRTTTGIVQRGTVRLSVDPIIRPVRTPVVRITTSLPSTYEYQRGSDITLNCELLSGGQGTNLYWQTGGWPSNVQTSGGRLTISSADEANSGTYVCVGSNSAGYDRKQVSIRMQREVIVFGNMPDRVEAPVNGRIELTCTVPTVRGLIQPSVYWRNSRGQKLTNATLLSTTWIIEPVRFTHAGNYTCVATVPGASSSKTVSLDVTYDQNSILRWLENPKRVQAQIGEIVTIDCKPSTPLSTSTEWRKENSASLPAGAVQRGTKLEFRSVKRSDAGTYICTATTSLGSAQLYANLAVDGAPGVPVITADGLRLPPSGLKQYRAGERATLQCFADGFPTPQYIWSRMTDVGGQEILRSGGNIRINDGTLRSQGSELVIYSVGLQDARYYNCTAYNRLGSREVYARLMIQTGSVAPSNVYVTGSGEGSRRNLYKTGQTAILRCAGRSTTPVTYRWTFDNGALPSNAEMKSGVLQINGLTRANQGTYYCTVTNDAGSSRPVASQVYVSGSPPAPVAPKTQYSSRVGGVLRLECVLPVDADRIEWSRDGRRALPASAIQSNNNQILELYDLRSDDGGVYRCYAVNSAGSSPSVSITISIEQSGRTPSRPVLAVGASASQQVYVGDDVTMSCIPVESISRTSWTHQSRTSFPRNSQIVGNTMQITDIQAEDGGRYLCRATNQYGTSEPLVHTIVVRRGGNVQAPEITGDSVVAIGDTFDLTCSSNYDTVRYTWSKLGGDLPASSSTSGGLLRLFNYQSSSDGVYICTIETADGTSSARHRLDSLETELSIVLKAEGVRPDITKFNEFAEGSELVLECTPSVNSATVRWERLGDSLPAHSYSSGNSLVFRRLEEVDRGSYRCHSKYGPSEVFGDYTFDVINTQTSGGRPVSSIGVTASPSSPVPRGSSVTLTCNALGDGIYYEWFLEDTRVVSSTDVQISDNILSIRNFLALDEGNYVCKASNIYGPAQSASINIQLR